MTKFIFNKTQTVTSQFQAQLATVTDNEINLSGNNLGDVDINDLSDLFRLLAELKNENGFSLNISRTNLGKKSPSLFLELLGCLIPSNATITSLNLSMNALGRQFSPEHILKMIYLFRRPNIIEIDLSTFDFSSIKTGLTQNPSKLKDF